MTALQTGIMVALFTVGTFLTRSLPFVAFPPGKPTPRYILYLGKVLPFAITTMLIVYCLKDTVVLAWPYALPEIIGIAVVTGLYLVCKNSLLAIAAGTILYMFLVQKVF